jgi:hypothetical protein
LAAKPVFDKFSAVTAACISLSSLALQGSIKSLSLAIIIFREPLFTTFGSAHKSRSALIASDESGYKKRRFKTTITARIYTPFATISAD